MENWKVKLGNFLFKWRSFTQLPWIVIVLIFLKPYYPVFTIKGEPFLTILGFLLAFSGEMLRIWTHLYALPGTSGRENYLRADFLNQDGPYRFVRNPLYLGNFLIVGGLLIVFSNILALFIGISFLIFQYSFIVLAEEKYLKEKFGNEWLEYKEKVPRFFPKKFFKIQPNQRKNSLSKVLIKEVDTIFNIFTMLFIILLLKINHLFRLSLKEVFPFLLFYSSILIIYIFFKVVKIKR
jgi:protein-S-isoprenylcysteine O-methyltransferase Ste14